jgi:1-deoxy-D-xylulose-5-phosphate reductoisomerase
LGLARRALPELGPLGGVVLNAADEVLVEAFLAERLGFTGIAHGIEAAMGWAHGAHLAHETPTLATITALDAETRAWALAWLAKQP